MEQQKVMQNDSDDKGNVNLDMQEEVSSFETNQILFSKFDHSLSMKNIKKNESVNILFNIQKHKKRVNNFADPYTILNSFYFSNETTLNSVLRFA